MAEGPSQQATRPMSISQVTIRIVSDPGPGRRRQGRRRLVDQPSDPAVQVRPGPEVTDHAEALEDDGRS